MAQHYCPKRWACRRRLQGSYPQLSCSHLEPQLHIQVPYHTWSYISTEHTVYIYIHMYMYIYILYIYMIIYIYNYIYTQYTYIYIDIYIEYIYIDIHKDGQLRTVDSASDDHSRGGSLCPQMSTVPWRWPCAWVIIGFCNLYGIYIYTHTKYTYTYIYICINIHIYICINI
jgi:hypothetical protein